MRQPRSSVSVARSAAAREPASRRAQRGRGLPAVAGLVLLLALVTLAALWLVDEGPADGDAGTATVSGPDVGRSPVIAAPDQGPSRSLAVAPSAVEADPDAPFSATERDALLATYARGSLEGRVVMADGSPLPDGVAVEASRRQPHPRVMRFSMGSMGELRESAAFEGLEPGQLQRLTRTEVDAEGRFTLDDVPADSSFWVGVVSDQVYQPRALPVSLRALEGELVLSVVRGATIEGRVLDPDGAGVAALQLKGGSTMDPWGMVAGGVTMVELDAVRCDESGRFRFAPVPVDVALVLSTMRERGFQPGTRKVDPLVPGEVLTLELRVHAGARLGGTVVDTDGAPVPRTSVRLQPTTFEASSMDVSGMVDFEADQTTDAEGRFDFRGLREGGYQLILSKGGFVPRMEGPFEVLVAAPLDDVVLVADRGLSVSGRCVDQQGELLAGVDVQGSLPVSMMSMRSRMDRPLRETVQTDEQGRFRLTGFEQGTVHLVAGHDSFSTATLDVAAGAEDVRLALQRKVSIRGIAIDLASGDPLERYSLRAGPAETLGFADLMDMGDRMRSLPAPLHVDDPEGRFELVGVEAGSYDLLVIADGYANTTVEDVRVAPEEGASGVIVMVAEEALLTGLVLSGRDGRPLADVRVTTGKTDAVGAVMSMLSGPALQTTTGADGRFELGGLSADKALTLSFQHATHRTLGLPQILPLEGDVLDLGVIHLPPGATVWGHVSDDRGDAEAGVAVLVSDQRGSQMKRVVSDDEGRYEVNGLAAGTLNVMRLDMSISLTSDNPMSGLSDMVFESVTLEDDEVKRVDLSRRDDGGVVLKGRVRGAAGPEADTTLVLVREDGPPSTRFGTTNDEGEYVFAGVDPGSYLLQVIPSGSLAGGGSQPSSPVLDTLTVTDAAVQHHDVAIPGGALRGEVRAKRDGELLSGIRVLLERVDEERPDSAFLERTGYRVGEAYTDDQGTFTFRHLPRGRYDLVVGGTNLIGLGDVGWAIQRVEGLEVREGSEGFAEVVELNPGCAISGVLSDDGKPVEGGPVWVKDELSGRWISTLSELASDAGGRFEINSLDIGSYTVAVGGQQHALAFVSGVRTVRNETRELDLELERGVEVTVDLNGHRRGDLSLSVTDPRGRSLPIGLTSMDDILGGQRNPGSLRVGRVEPGTYGVEVYEFGSLLEQKVVAVRLDDDPMTLTLPAPEGDD